MKSAWENGARVPVTDADDFYDEDDEPRQERSALEVLRTMGALWLGHDRGMFAECFALAVGLVFDGGSMADIARRHGVTRAAVSKRCIQICQHMDIPPSRAMRPKINHGNCRKARKLTYAGGWNG